MPQLTVTLDGATHRLEWPRDAVLVDVLIEAGVDAPYSCRDGHCGSCVTTVTHGEVSMATSDILEPEDLAEGLILACQATPASDDVEVEY